MPINLEIACWEQDRLHIEAIRFAVYMVEKGSTSTLASDREDSCCQHVLATDYDGRHVATGRLECDGRLSRIVVLPEFRQHRLGDDVLSFLIDLARELGLETVYADVAERHIPFLLEMGFVEKEPTSLPPGAHRRPQRYMELNLKARSSDPE